MSLVLTVVLTAASPATVTGTIPGTTPGTMPGTMPEAPETPQTPAGKGETAVLPIRDIVALLPVVEEHGLDGYGRDAFPHWLDADGDGCDTRSEVLRQESLRPVSLGADCELSGGRWYAFWEDEYLGADRVDVAHLVPPVEAWQSGASGWTAERRERYANDLDFPRALTAQSRDVTGHRAGLDPADWLPPSRAAQCHYLAQWSVIKLRWDLAVDPREHRALTALAARCPNAPVTVTYPAYPAG